MSPIDGKGNSPMDRLTPSAQTSVRLSLSDATTTFIEPRLGSGYVQVNQRKRVISSYPC
jgi:hypothetical protein